MIDGEDLVRGVLRGVLGGRRKRSRKALRYLSRGSSGLSARTLLTMAGVAWGVVETLQGQGGAPAGAPNVPRPNAGPGSAVPPPLPGGAAAPAVPPDALRMVRLAIAAAKADGALSDRDREAVMEQARSAGAEHVVAGELERPQPLAEIVGGVADPAAAATLYVLAFSVARGDETVSGAERIFLAQLANHLGLSPDTVATLEADTVSRIDSQT